MEKKFLWAWNFYPLPKAFFLHKFPPKVSTLFAESFKGFCFALFAKHRAGSLPGFRLSDAGLALFCRHNRPPF